MARSALSVNDAVSPFIGDISILLFIYYLCLAVFPSLRFSFLPIQKLFNRQNDKKKQGSFHNINDTSNIFYNSSAWRHDPKSCWPLLTNKTWFTTWFTTTIKVVHSGPAASNALPDEPGGLLYLQEDNRLNSFCVKNSLSSKLTSTSNVSNHIIHSRKLPFLIPFTATKQDKMNFNTIPVDQSILP